MEDIVLTVKHQCDGEGIEIVSQNPAVLAALANVGDDDPAIFLNWNVANLGAAVNWANTLAGNNHQPAALPTWYAGGAGTYPITVFELQRNISPRIWQVLGAGRCRETAFWLQILWCKVFEL